MNVVKVGSRGDLRRFIELPYTWYAHHPVWVPPLRLDEWEQFNPRKNPALEHLEIDLFLAYQDQKPVGRVGAIINRRHDELHGSNVAFFGFFEAQNLQTAKHLLHRVEAWAQKRGRDLLRGPTNPTLNDPCGFQIDAFESRPYLLTPYNPPEYIDYVDSLGFVKIRDLFAWEVDLANPKSSQLERIAERIMKRGQITIRQVDMKNFDREVETILDIYTSAWADNWGFVPPSASEFRAAARKMKMILHPSLILFAEIEGQSAAFSVTLPDINQALEKIGGRLFPFGLVRLLLERKKITRNRMPLLGVRPEFRGRGLFAPLITESIRNARSLGHTVGESSWTLEDNTDISRAIQAAGGTLYKTYRIFQKQL